MQSSRKAAASSRNPAKPEKPPPESVATARLTCGQPPTQAPFPQVSPKREDLTHLKLFRQASDMRTWQEESVTVANFRSPPKQAFLALFRCLARGSRTKLWCCGGRRAPPQAAGGGAVRGRRGVVRLHLAAENKAAGTVGPTLRRRCGSPPRTCSARRARPRWGRSARVMSSGGRCGCWAAYSDAYARNQFRALQQFFRWLAAEDGIPDPMARLRPPREAPKPVPCFTSVELSRLRKACRGSSFDDRRDAAVIAVFLATGIRLAEMAGIRYLLPIPTAVTLTWPPARLRCGARAAGRDGEAVP